MGVKIYSSHPSDSIAMSLLYGSVFHEEPFEVLAASYVAANDESTAPRRKKHIYS